MTQSKPDTQQDGRRQRTERSRNAIVNAALDLINEGQLTPTAQQISERAGVGIRTFFRHFEDMNQLSKAVDESIRDDYIELTLGGDRQGSVAERITHAVEQHADLYDRNSNIILSAAAMRWKNEFLVHNYAKTQRGLRKDLDNWLPELLEVDRTTREAVDAIASFEMWHRLRGHQGLSKKSSIEIVSKLIKDLLIGQQRR